MHRLYRSVFAALMLVAFFSAECAAGEPHAPQDMTFKYAGNSKLMAALDFDFRFIYATGEITAGTGAKFEELVRKNAIKPGAVVIFNSPGGSVAEALELGRAIRASGFNTDVEGKTRDKKGNVTGPAGACFSACTLAFLGGVERFVSDDAFFGVHQVSTSINLTSGQALELGQLTIGEIVEYASFMGAKPEFVYELTRTSPADINLLSPEKLQALNVTTPRFKTDWKIKSVQGVFYLLATTNTNGGVDKMILSCINASPTLLFMFNTTGQFKADTLSYTTDYGFEFDKYHMDLQPSEVLQKVSDGQGDYVVATIQLSARILERLRSTNDLTFEMMMPSHTTYAGWTMDFANGRDQFFSFLQTCH